MKISALVLTKNEKDLIEETLSQLKFCDEIIVLDQDSKDQTVKLVKKHTQNVSSTKVGDFDKNRNTLASLAKGQWLLYIDADERLQPDGIKEIKNALQKDKYSAYYFPRENYILGKLLKHGGWSPDYVPRLFKKNSLVKWTGKVHETPQVKGVFGYLETPLVHKTARSMKLMFEKSIKWAQVEAQLNFKAGAKKVTIFKVIRFSAFEFFRRYFIKLGFLDGKVGFIAALYQAIHQAMVLTYLWELQKNE